jgi:hypothetical protein
MGIKATRDDAEATRNEPSRAARESAVLPDPACDDHDLGPIAGESAAHPRTGSGTNPSDKGNPAGARIGRSYQTNPRGAQRENGVVIRRSNGRSRRPSMPIGMVAKRRVRLLDRNRGSQKLKIVP